MAFIHGKGSVVTIGGSDLSVYGASVEWARKADVHDITTFGKDAHVKQGGLLDGTAKVEGIYDNSATVGPRAVLNPKLGTTVVMVWRPEGTGTGKPNDSVNVVVGGYTESSPVADMVKWTLDLELSDVVTTTTQ